MTAIQSVAVIVGVIITITGLVFAGLQLAELSKQTGVLASQLAEISQQTKLSAQSLQQAQRTESATLVLQLRGILDSDRYAKISAEIQNNDQKYPLVRHKKPGRSGKFRDLDVERYISNFEDIGLLLQNNLMFSEMAYDDFSYDIEKTWCNLDVQQIVKEARTADKSITAASDPIFGDFEKLAQSYLSKEQQTCKDLDNQ